MFWRDAKVRAGLAYAGDPHTLGRLGVLPRGMESRKFEVRMRRRRR
jgi:hypothetical protein